MAGKTNRKSKVSKQTQKRVEPHFGIGWPRSDPDVRIEHKDRVVSPGKTAKPKRKSASRKSPSKKKTSARRKYTSRSGAKRRSLGFRLVRGGLYWGVVLGIWGVLIVGSIVGYYATKLPQSSQWAVPQRPPNAKIVSTSGTLIANRGATGGEVTNLSNMSPYLPMAVISIEDRRFKSHFGFDPIGFTRAMVANVMAGRLVQGGSTLTQQLAKNLFLKPERTFERKVQELILAVWLETKFSKDEILEMYLNRVYFGAGATGVDAASRRYFGKPARDVNLGEAALLAGLLKAPSKLSPAKNPKRAQARSQIVLAAMRREGYITVREATKALSVKANKAKRYRTGSEHYVADYVMREVERILGELNHDVIVDTTIDWELQRAAANEIAQTLDKKGKAFLVSQGAAITFDTSGSIRVLVGGREYSQSQFNRAVDAKRQPGSSFKPFVYLAALEQGKTPESIRHDAPVKIGNWTPRNYDKKYRGPVSLDHALAGSLNTISAQLVMEVGPQTVVSIAQRLGIRSKLNSNASISLGTSEVTLDELTAAYVPLANGGYKVSPHIIKRIKTPDGELIYERKTEPAQIVINPREVGMMNAMLRSAVEKGTGKAARMKGWQAAGKTGTSQNSRDALFIGYTANLVTGVWYGNDDGSPTKKLTGGSIPARTWRTIMEKAHEELVFADLPGNYLTQVNVVPTARPERRIGINRILEPINGTKLAQERGSKHQERRPLADVDRMGGEPKKPKSILDILFGS